MALACDTLPNDSLMYQFILKAEVMDRIHTLSNHIKAILQSPAVTLTSEFDLGLAQEILENLSCMQ
jgi:hypothetical protein